LSETPEPFTEEDKNKMRFLFGSQMTEAALLVDYEFRRGKCPDPETAKRYLESRERMKKTLERFIVPP
jgi:hypothetical protein